MVYVIALQEQKALQGLSLPCNVRSRTKIWLVFQQAVGFPLFATEMQSNQIDRTELL